VKYLFDTDTLSSLLRRAPPLFLLRRLALTPLEEQCTSSITVGELHYGAQRRLGSESALIRRIEDQLLGSMLVLPFDGPAARQYGELRAGFERRGLPIGDADTRIASIALVHGLTVVTGNVRHFSRVPGLALENWLEPDTASRS
jgi:tRNA(fMet)-specific endonuclease VapC